MTNHFYFKNSEPLYETEYKCICKVSSSLQCRKYFPHMSLIGVLAGVSMDSDV